MAVAGPNQLAQFSYLLSKVQDKNFRDTKTQLPDICGSFTKQGDTTRGQDYRSATTVGLGPFQQTAEFGQFKKDQFEPGQERVSSWYKYTNGVVISEELLWYMANNKRVYEDKVKMFEGINQEFKDTWQWTKEVVCTLFQTAGTSTAQNGAFNGTGRDGLSLFSASHTSIKQPVVTITNLQGSQPMSQLAIQEGVTMLRNMVNDEGRPQPPVTDVLISAGKWWEWRLQEIFGTEKQLDTFNNNINPLVTNGEDKNAVKRRYRYVINDYLAATDTSWMIMDGKNHPLYQFEFLEPTFQKEKDISTGAMIFKCTTIHGIDFLSFRNIVRCAGV